MSLGYKLQGTEDIAAGGWRVPIDIAEMQPKKNKDERDGQEMENQDFDKNSSLLLGMENSEMTTAV